MVLVWRDPRDSDPRLGDFRQTLQDFQKKIPPAKWSGFTNLFEVDPYLKSP